jgi:hypothetical protein
MSQSDDRGISFTVAISSVIAANECAFRRGIQSPIYKLVTAADSNCDDYRIMMENIVGMVPRFNSADLQCS